MTKENKLLHFIKSGPNQTRTWSECRAFYSTISHQPFKAGTNNLWYWCTNRWYTVTEEEAKVRNVRYAGRAMDYSLYRLEKKGLTANIARGLHQAK